MGARVTDANSFEHTNERTFVGYPNGDKTFFYWSRPSEASPLPPFIEIPILCPPRRFAIVCTSCLRRVVAQVAVEEGVLFGAGKILQYQKTVASDDSRTYFLPNAEAMGLVEQVAALVEDESLRLGAVGTEYVGMQEYMEALAWPKDSDTGLRYARVGRSCLCAVSAQGVDPYFYLNNRFMTVSRTLRLNESRIVFYGLGFALPART